MIDWNDRTPQFVCNECETAFLVCWELAEDPEFCPYCGSTHVVSSDLLDEDFE